MQIYLGMTPSEHRDPAIFHDLENAKAALQSQWELQSSLASDIVQVCGSVIYALGKFYSLLRYTPAEVFPLFIMGLLQSWCPHISGLLGNSHKVEKGACPTVPNLTV